MNMIKKSMNKVNIGGCLTCQWVEEGQGQPTSHASQALWQHTPTHTTVTPQRAFYVLEKPLDAEEE